MIFKKKIIYQALLFTSPALSLSSISKYGYTLPPLILALWGLILFLFKNSSQQPTIQQQMVQDNWLNLRRLAWTVWIFAIVTVLIDSFWGIHLGAYEAFIPFFLYPFMIWVFKSYPEQLRAVSSWVWLGAASGAILGLVFSVYQHAVMDIDRASMHGSAISSGNTGVVLAAASAVAYLYAGSAFTAFSRALLLMGAISGIATSLLSGSKGGWLSIVLMATIFWPTLSKKWSMKTKALTLFSVFVFSSVILFHPASPVHKRLQHAIEGLNHWVETGVDADGSVGSRLSMWRFGLSVADEKPIFGFGTKGLETRWKEEIDTGKADPNWGPKGHLHNEMLTIYLMRGAVGLCVALAIYVFGFRYFWRHKNSLQPEVKASAMMGMMLMILYLEFGLSDTIWLLNANRQIFLFWYFVLAGLIFVHVSNNHAQNQNR